MSGNKKILALYDHISKCRKCSAVIPNKICKKVLPDSLNTKIMLVAQAPGEYGVRVSGQHWIDKNGRFRKSGKFLHNCLREIGHGIDPHEIQTRSLRRPYITNVLQCWPGKSRKLGRDRKPSVSELINCGKWIKEELSLIKPVVIILLGKPAAESFLFNKASKMSFHDLIRHFQNGRVCRKFKDLQSYCFVLPHPASGFKDKTGWYNRILGNALKLIQKKEIKQP